jgi:hypothetical protein
MILWVFKLFSSSSFPLFEKDSFFFFFPLYASPYIALFFSLTNGLLFFFSPFPSPSFEACHTSFSQI